MALSTLRPATSPHLSAIKLDFAGPHLPNLPIDTVINDTGGDLRRVAYEVVRIEREFEGAVLFSVTRDSTFEVVLDTLDVRPYFVRWKGPWVC